MEVYKDVVSQDLIDKCLKEIKDPSIPKSVWKQYGKVLYTEVFPTELHQALEPYLKKVYEDTKTEKISYAYYIWQVGSNLMMHRDESYTFGATLYLNKFWPPDYGGLFVYDDPSKEGLEVLCPTQNALVINSRRENHMVTHITDLSKYDRLTVQIRGHSKSLYKDESGSTYDTLQYP